MIMKIAIKQVRGGAGIDVWAENLCRGIKSQGHQCNLDLQSAMYQFFPFLVKIQKKDPEFDIIHGNTWNAFAYKTAVPLVVTEHHIVHDPAFNPYRTLQQKVYHQWIYRCEQKSLRVADAVTCDCEYTRKKLEEIFGYSTSHIVYPGIDNTLFRPVDVRISEWNIPNDPTVVFFAGNLSTRKGADLLPSIMDRLGDEYTLLVASGQKQGSVLGCKNIINLGDLRLNQLVAIYNRCDIFLTPSRLEGFGLSVAEAMACEKPVVATNCSSLPELVADGKGGFLCRMDDVDDFAEKIRHLAADENLRLEMGLFNRKRVEEKFTIEKMTQGYLQVYRSIIH
jgi:glycosyltransferase involved in cell wall biosynthesis